MKRYSKLLFPALLLFAAFHVSTAWAQKKYDEQKAEITKVKRAPEKYVYAEATCKTLEEAKDVAEEMFYEAVNEYVAELKKEKGKNDFVINDAKAIFNEISMPRGSNMQRVFLYAKKSDIIAMKNPVVLSKMNKEEYFENLICEQRLMLLGYHQENISFEYIQQSNSCLDMKVSNFCDLEEGFGKLYFPNFQGILFDPLNNCFRYYNSSSPLGEMFR